MPREALSKPREIPPELRLRQAGNRSRRSPQYRAICRTGLVQADKPGSRIGLHREGAAPISRFDAPSRRNSFEECGAASLRSAPRSMDAKQNFFPVSGMELWSLLALMAMAWPGRAGPGPEEL